ncbi:UbiA family prenyltransferase [Candidatus Woesearchaeota archaeon]|nr:UbiA family prenyltransferase [Candidatus Woesearchaeota archaeon]
MQVQTLLKKRLSLKQIIVLVIVLSSVRVVLEWMLLTYPIELDGTQDYIRFYLENVYYFIIAFLLISVALSLIIKKSFIDVANFGARMYMVILLPPLLDFFIFNRTAGYVYATIPNFLGNLFTLSIVQGDASYGIILELILALSGVSWYAFTRSKSLLRTAAAIFAITLIITILSTPDIFFGEGKGDFYYDYFLPAYYFLPLLVLSSILYYNANNKNKKKLWAMLFELRPGRAVKFMIVAALGVLAAYSFGYSINWYNAAYAIIAIFFVRQSAVALNDIYDYSIDKISNAKRPLVKKTLEKHELKNIALICSAFAISLSAIINLKVLFIVLIGLLFGVLYSVPPFRLRNNLLGHFIIALSLLICLASGFLITNDASKILSSLNLKFGAWLLITGLSSSFSKDFKDIKGDSKEKIINLYTLLGRNKGKKIVTYLLFFSFLIPSLFIQNPAFIAGSAATAIATAFLYYKKGDERPVYLMSSIFGIIVFYMLYMV